MTRGDWCGTPWSALSLDPQVLLAQQLAQFGVERCQAACGYGSLIGQQHAAVALEADHPDAARAGHTCQPRPEQESPRPLQRQACEEVEVELHDDALVAGADLVILKLVLAVRGAADHVVEHDAAALVIAE